MSAGGQDEEDVGQRTVRSIPPTRTTIAQRETRGTKAAAAAPTRTNPSIASRPENGDPVGFPRSTNAQGSNASISQRMPRT